MRNTGRPWRNRYPNDNPSAYNIFAYASAKVLVAALDKAGPDLTPASLIAALMNSMHNYDNGLTGPISFSPDNHMGGALGVDAPGP